MKRIERDFVTLFNYLWYKDFPVTETAGLANRANWTIHMGLVIRQCASLMGARALFESGGRTDAVVQYCEKDILTFVEWEWKRAHTDINEIEKLYSKAGQAAFQTFIGYSRVEDIQKALDQTLNTWNDAKAEADTLNEELATHLLRAGPLTPEQQAAWLPGLDGRLGARRYQNDGRYYNANSAVLTLSWLVSNLEARGAASVAVVALLRKPAAAKVQVDVKWVGFEIPNEFVVGYGLDYDERYRTLKGVAVLSPEVYG